MTPVVKFESPEAMSIVKQAIQEKYHLAETEMNEFFCDAIPIGLGEEDGMLYRMQFHTHYQMSQEMKYGAVINLGTGKWKRFIAMIRNNGRGKYKSLLLARKWNLAWLVYSLGSGKQSQTDRNAAGDSNAAGS